MSENFAPVRVKLDKLLAQKFAATSGRRRALLDAAEVMARQFADQVEACNHAVQEAYAEAAQRHSLDLQRCGYEFDQDTGELVLKAVRYD